MAVCSYDLEIQIYNVEAFQTRHTSSIDESYCRLKYIEVEVIVLAFNGVSSRPVMDMRLENEFQKRDDRPCSLF
jgi:hypothetical protein